jgi:hypothetical protein
MLDTYRRILTVPGAFAFSAAALVARLPMSMAGLGIVLLVSERTGSYGLAGTVTAAMVLAQAVFAMPHGRWVDVWGQWRVLPLAVSITGAAFALLMVAVEMSWPMAWTYAFATIAGASLPQVGACVRTRWSHVLDDASDVQTAFALEAVLDEVVFVLGPVLVTVLATSWHPLAGLSIAAASGLVGTWAFALQRSTEPPARGRRTPGSHSPMPWRLVLSLALVCLLLGALFGAAEVTTVAFAEEQGAKWLSGPLLASWSLGSLVAGIATGAIHWTSGPSGRLRWGAAAMAVAMAPLALVGSIAVMFAVLFVGGMAIAPTMIAAMTMVEQGVPTSRLTEGMAVLHTGIVAGVAPGAGIAGFVIDHTSASTAYLVALAAGVGGALIAQTVPTGRQVA